MDNIFPILYKLTENNQVQTWQIVVEQDYFYTLEGVENSVITKSLPTYCKGKNIGKKNQTTNSEQAYKEALAKFTKKKDKGYVHVSFYFWEVHLEHLLKH